MNIYAFDVRDDEMECFHKLEKECQVEITYSKDSLSDTTVSLTKGYEGITILGGTQVRDSLLLQLKNNGVKYISTRTIGYNHIDISSAKELGLLVSNAFYQPYGVANYTVMLMLMSLRHYKQALFRGNVNDYSLAGMLGREMQNLTVGVIGTGKIGTAVITNLSGFGCNILAYDKLKPSYMGVQNPQIDSLPNGINQETYTDKNPSYVSLEELYRKSDIITLHTPLLDSTFHMINKDTIALMKDGVILINCARGPLICLKDLIKGIESKKIGAVGLDVVENEEGIYHKDLRTDILQNRDMAYLRQFPNVIMTQHMAFYTQEAVNSMVECGIRNLIACKELGTCDLLL